METLAKTNAFITLKDHEESLQTTYNPAKLNMGRVNKRILDIIITIFGKQQQLLQGEVPPKMKKSFLVVFGTLS